MRWPLTNVSLTVGLGQRGSRTPSGGDPSRGDASVMDTRTIWALVALTPAFVGTIRRGIWGNTRGSGTMTGRASGSRVQHGMKQRRRSRKKASEWGWMPLLVVLVVIMYFVLAMTGVSLPDSPLLPR